MITILEMSQMFRKVVNQDTFNQKRIYFYQFIMKIEENCSAGSQKSRVKNRFFLQTSLHSKPSYLQKENERLIKNIHQKIYPLNYAQRSCLIFPKLKQQKDNNIEITLQDNQQNISLLKHRTDLEDEHFFKAKLIKTKTMQKIKTTQDNQGQQLKNQEVDRSNKSLQSLIYHVDMCLMTQKIQNNSLFDQSQTNTNFFHNEGQRILIQSLRHFNFMKKMKQDIKKKKDLYFKNLKMAQIFQNNIGAKKQNYSIQYLVKSIQNKSTKNSLNISPYEHQSPNKLRQFANFFEKKNRNLLLWEQLELTEPILEKEKSTGEQPKSNHNIRSKNIHKTIIEEQSEINMQNILSAKYRLKTNHKRIIQLAKTKLV